MSTVNIAVWGADGKPFRKPVEGEAVTRAWAATRDTLIVDSWRVTCIRTGQSAASGLTKAQAQQLARLLAAVDDLPRGRFGQQTSPYPTETLRALGEVKDEFLAAIEGGRKG